MAASSEGAAPACRGEGKRLLVSVEQRTSEGAAVGRTISHHDRLGRLTRVERDFDGDGKAEQVDLHSYDESGKLIAVENAEMTERYQLDRDGRIVVRESQQKGSPLVARVVTTYDERGRVVREVSEDEEARYSYDATGREVREQRVRVGEDAAYLDYVTTSDAVGRGLLQQGRDPNGALRKTWSYDERGREVERQWYRDGALLSRIRTSYDATGRRAREEQFNAAGALVGWEAWTYDALGEEASHRTESVERASWVEERYGYTAPMKCRR